MLMVQSYDWVTLTYKYHLIRGKTGHFQYFDSYSYPSRSETLETLFQVHRSHKIVLQLFLTFRFILRSILCAFSLIGSPINRIPHYLSWYTRKSVSTSSVHGPNKLPHNHQYHSASSFVPSHHHYPLNIVDPPHHHCPLNHVHPIRQQHSFHCRLEPPHQILRQLTWESPLPNHQIWESRKLQMIRLGFRLRFGEKEDEVGAGPLRVVNTISFIMMKDLEHLTNQIGNHVLVDNNNNTSMRHN